MKLVVYRLPPLAPSRHCWRWRLVGRNGEVIAHGEGYTRRASVIRAVKRIQAGIATATIEVQT